MTAASSATLRFVLAAILAAGVHGCARATATPAQDPRGDSVAPLPLPPLHADTAASADTADDAATAESRAARATAAASARAAALQRFRARLAADVEADGVGSIAAAVVVGDTVVWSGAFGAADAERGVAATPGTLYRIGSISKAITAAVLLRLVESGEIGLDEPVAVYVPELAGLANHPRTARPITFRDLATHTAGLDREPAASHAGRGRVRHWSRKVVEAIPLTAVRGRPGESYVYSNIGYGILGLALQRAAGLPFERLVREHVFERLGMSRSFFTVPPADRPRLAIGYVNVDDGTVDPRVPRAEHGGRGYKLPSEGVYSTVEDLARLLMGLSGALGDTLLPHESREAMLRPRGPADRAGGDPAAGPTEAADTARVGYGIGLHVTRIGGARLAGHGGTVAGYTAYLVFDPDSRTGVVLLRNYNRGRTNLAALAQGLVLDLRVADPS